MYACLDKLHFWQNDRDILRVTAVTRWWTRDRKVARSNPAGAAEECSSPELTLCADCYSVSVPTPVLSQWHVEDPCSEKSASGRLHPNTLIQRSRSGLTILLSRHSVGTYSETSSPATCRETFCHSRLIPLSHCGLVRA